MRQSLKGKDADWLWQRSSTWHQMTPVPFSARLCVQQLERQPWAILSQLMSKVFSWSESLNMSLSKIWGLSFLNFEYNNLLLNTALYLRSWNICNFLTLWENGEINSISTTYGFDVLFCLFFYRSVTEAAVFLGWILWWILFKKHFENTSLLCFGWMK